MEAAFCFCPQFSVIAHSSLMREVHSLIFRWGHGHRQGPSLKPKFDSRGWEVRKPCPRTFSAYGVRMSEVQEETRRQRAKKGRGREWRG